MKHAYLGRFIADLLAAFHVGRLEHPLLCCRGHRRLSVLSNMLYLDSLYDFPRTADLRLRSHGVSSTYALGGDITCSWLIDRKGSHTLFAERHQQTHHDMLMLNRR